MTNKKMLELSKKRTQIFEDMLEKITLVEKGKIKITDKSLKKLNKELDKTEKLYKKALKNV